MTAPADFYAEPHEITPHTIARARQVFTAEELLSAEAIAQDEYDSIATAGDTADRYWDEVLANFMTGNKWSPSDMAELAAQDDRTVATILAMARTDWHQMPSFTPPA